MTKTLQRFTGAAVTLLLLGAVAIEAASRPRPKDAEPFHQKIKELGAAVPLRIGDWTGEDGEITKAALVLLRPNLYISRRYVNAQDGRVANLLIVQCRTARDMAGHYPPVCYPAHGWEKVSSAPAEWQVGPRRLPGMEYEYSRELQGRQEAYVICNLLILPDGRFVREMDQIYRAAGSYLRQFYGAAQVQVVMRADYPPETRARIVDELLGPNLPLLEAMASGDTK